MKKHIIIYIAAILTIAMWSCDSKSKDAGHDHHDHAHNEEGHNHDHDHDHDHDHNDDEIIITQEQAETIGLETLKVKLGAFNQVIKTSGQIVAAQGDERTVVATVSGVVSFNKASAEEGKAVRQGESLFNISAKHLADGDPVLRAKISFETAQREFERAEALIVDRLISQQEYNDKKLAFENARIAYQAISGGGGKGANVSSPITGFVKSRLVTEGQYVNVGEPLMVVTQNNKLQLRADVSQRHYKDLPTIQSANFSTPYDNAMYSLADMGGQLISYGRTTSNTEFYLPINFQFNNVGGVVPGSFVEVYLLGTARDNVMTIPVSSLTDEQGLYFVYCKLDAEGYLKKEVRIGTTDGVNVEILSGLEVGDEVVTKGAYHVKLASLGGESIPHSHEH